MSPDFEKALAIAEKAQAHAEKQREEAVIAADVMRMMAHAGAAGAAKAIAHLIRAEAEKAST